MTVNKITWKYFQYRVVNEQVKGQIKRWYTNEDTESDSEPEECIGIFQ